MKLALNGAKYPETAFAIVFPGVFNADRRLEVHLGEALESDSPIADVSCALERVEFEAESYRIYD